jgi:hypothetical protein
MATTDQRRTGERVVFEKGHEAHLMAIDGTWRRDCRLLDVSETGGKLIVEASMVGLNLKEFFLLLSSTGLAYRRCELAWVNGDQIGVNFLKVGQNRKRLARSSEEAEAWQAVQTERPRLRSNPFSEQVPAGSRHDVIWYFPLYRQPSPERGGGEWDGASSSRFSALRLPRWQQSRRAFLKEATKPGAAPERSAQTQMKGMGGMMGGMMGGGGRDHYLKI